MSNLSESQAKLVKRMSSYINAVIKSNEPAPQQLQTLLKYLNDYLPNAEILIDQAFNKAVKRTHTFPYGHLSREELIKMLALTGKREVDQIYDILGAVEALSLAQSITKKELKFLKTNYKNNPLLNGDLAGFLDCIENQIAKEEGYDYSSDDQSDYNDEGYSSSYDGGWQSYMRSSQYNDGLDDDQNYANYEMM
jgi:hypothetical protein